MPLTFTLTADDQTEPFTAVGDFKVHMAGTFGGGAVTIEEKINNSFETIVGTSQTSDEDFVYDPSTDDSGIFRFDISGSTTPVVVITVSGKVRPVKSEV